ncbi:hypothetical protein M141_2854 [Bacteroides fragilis str. S38L5]|nr:hypothetical protein M141_2854 [Bacteroides fragilis str. S38L5]EYB13885.1 hypothetical protein M140_2799 [Bacteroides fragilis str. S38L3]
MAQNFRKSSRKIASTCRLVIVRTGTWCSLLLATSFHISAISITVVKALT